MKNNSFEIFHTRVTVRRVGFILCLVSVVCFCFFFTINTASRSVLIEQTMKANNMVVEAVHHMLDAKAVYAMDESRALNTTFNTSVVPTAFLRATVSKGNYVVKANESNGDVKEMAVETDRHTDIITTKTTTRRTTLPPTPAPARPDHCNNCFTHAFKYVIENNNACRQYSKNETIDLLILIFTIHSNFNIRQAIRSTWLTSSRNNTANVRYAFLLGEVTSDRERTAIVQESETFGDILKEDFVDKYTNLTYKTIMGFKWAVTVCPSAKFVMKTDDDMFVNVPNVLNLVKANADILQTNVGGSCSPSAEPIRDRNSKWFASVRSYPNSAYPGYCSGTGYVTSMNVVRRVYEISPHVPFFHLEDVYVSLCVRELGYHLKAFPGFNAGRPTMDPCLYKGGELKTSHGLSAINLVEIWNKPCRARI